MAAWQRLGRQPRTALILMTLSAGIGTLLATLCKENGALLPGLLLILDRVLLAQSRTSDTVGLPGRHEQWYRWWRIGLLWLPTAALLVYLALNVPDFIDGHRSRAFTFGERLLTESRILLQY